MKKYLSFILFIALLSLFSCQTVDEHKKTKDSAPLIGKPEIRLKSDRMRPEVLWSFGRLSDPQVSPDGRTVLYGVSYYLNKLF